MALHPLISEAFHGAVNLLFPQLCEGCRTPLLYQEKVLCMSCALKLPETSGHHLPLNEAGLRIAGRIPFQHATALAYFTPDGLLQHLLHRLKYSGRSEIGIYLGRRLGNALKPTDWAADITGIAPIPLHPKKELKRGYNQSALIAQGLSEILERPVLEKALRRTRHTQSQTSMTREERVNNMKEAFTQGAGMRSGHQHILLIDDVLTTGATLEAASEVLLRVPGVRLSIATVGLAKD